MLAEFLVQQGVIRPAAMQGALEALAVSAARLDTALLDLGLVGEEQMLTALGRFHKTRTATGAELVLASPEVARLIPPRVAARFEVVPFRLDGKTLHVAFADPGDLFVEDELAALTGCMVVSFVALEARVYQALARLYGVERSPQMTSVARRLDGERSPRPAVPAAAAPGHRTTPTPPAPPTVATPAPTPPRSRSVTPSELEISAEDLELFPSLRARASDPVSTTGAELEAPAAPVPAPVATVPAPPSPEIASIPLEGTPGERLVLAAAALEAAEMRDDIADVLLEYCRPYLKRRLIAVLRGSTVVGWRGEGEGVVREVLRAISIPLDQPSVFMGLAQGQAFWLGPLPPMPRNLDLVLGLGGDAPKECLILPIALRGKIVCFLYGDNGGEPVRSVPLGELRRLVAKAGVAFQVYLLKGKIRTL